MLKKIFPLVLGIGFLSTTTYASPYGINFSYLLVGKDPSHLHGYRASFLYEPPSWVWKHVQIFIDTSFGRWWVNESDPYRSVNIYSIAPVLRYYINDYTYFSPFIDISIGPSYVNRTHINDKNLGIHFLFQDQVGVGASFGHDKKYTASLSMMHYSNGSLCKLNSGMTMPVMLNVSYRF